MNLSKKQEKAIDIACRVMSAALSSGIDSDEDGVNRHYVLKCLTYIKVKRQSFRTLDNALARNAKLHGIT